jgi:hypothetical protein
LKTNKTAIALAGIALLLVAGIVFMLFGPMTSTFQPPERQGQAMLVMHEGKPKLWLLLKQEESRQVSYGGGGRSIGGFRNDSFFHFDLQAHDVRTTQPAWKLRLLTLGDPAAGGSNPSRVIGSSAGARLLGQEGDTVWALVDHRPMALSAADGSVKADAAALQQRNPALKGMLPSSSDLYAFEAGLVITAADAQRWRVQGGGFSATPYQPPAPPKAPPPTHWISTPPIGEPMVRQARIDGTWLGLYTEREAADAGNDEFGRRYNQPFIVVNDGPLARRSFWRARIGKTREFPEGRHDRLFDVTPVSGSPAFLRGRFFHVPGSLQALAMSDPSGLLVQHQTRIDSEGRVAISRIDSELKTLWTAALPMTELSSRWISPTQLLLLGTEQTLRDGVRSREEQLVALDLADGKLRSWNLQKAQAAQ